jgi:signal transduction histidine kinase
VSLLVVLAAIVATTAPDWYAVLQAALLLQVVSVFACARYGRTRWRYLALVTTELLVVVQAWVLPGERFASNWAWGLNAWWIFAIGLVFRRERILREQLVHSAGAEARAREAEQRLALAREVHDVVSNGLAVVVVQAQLAQLHLTTDPALAQRALESVEAAGRSALTETRRMLDDLRESRGQEVPSVAPIWTDVPALVLRMRESGLPVTLELPTDPPKLTTVVSATAYRVVQESLTNALRHAGSAPTSVRAVIAQGDLVIDIHDEGDAPARASDHHGHGLAGMRERVGECGGTLTSGPAAEGGFSVRAVLPAGLTP